MFWMANYHTIDYIMTWEGIYQRLELQNLPAVSVFIRRQAGDKGIEPSFWFQCPAHSPVLNLCSTHQPLCSHSLLEKQNTVPRCTQEKKLFTITFLQWLGLYEEITSLQSPHLPGISDFSGSIQLVLSMETAQLCRAQTLGLLHHPRCV